MLTELHSGFAFPWTPQFVVPFGLATGSKGHHYHHRNGKHYYQKVRFILDRAQVLTPRQTKITNKQNLNSSFVMLTKFLDSFKRRIKH